MNRNFSNPDHSEGGNAYGIKKTTYWEIYGVKRFPYNGKRKFIPLLSQSLDGGIVISNDVFGLTISQFERMYKACLERRKTKEQYILNLQYPDKSSNEYLEYLQNCTDSYKDHLLLVDPKETYLYEELVKIVGTEIEIRTRQRLFIIQDSILNSCKCLPNRTQISSGSLAEGFDLPGSDVDTMYEVNTFEAVQNVRNIKHPIKRDTFEIETDINHPGFTRLRLVAKSDRNSCIKVVCNLPAGTCSCKLIYLTHNTFLKLYKSFYVHARLHGPCISNENMTVDHAYCIRSKKLPYNAIKWATRHRWQWPSNFVIERTKRYGCLLVPVGPTTVSDNTLWRFSFSVAEKMLVTFVQFHTAFMLWFT